MLNAEDVRGLLLPLLEHAQAEESQKRKSVDLSFVRVNIHQQRGIRDKNSRGLFYTRAVRLS